MVMDELASLDPRFPDLDLTEIPLITVDPPTSKDLDQAFHLEQVRGGYRVTYAIADVAAFVNPGGAIDVEGHSRGQTFYGPDLRTPLYPTELSEVRASLRADQTRPALVWRIDLDRQGEIIDGQIKRGMVRSRAQFAYQDIQDQLESGSGSPSVQLLPEVGRLRQIIEVERGAVTLNIPEQEVFRRDGGWDLNYRTPFAVEGWNAQLSLLTGFFAAKLMVGAGVGILRTLPPADPARTDRLRRVAQGLHIAWPDDLPYPDLIRSLDPDLASHSAFLAEATGLFSGAGYQPLTGDDMPEPHAALAAVYAHTTAPLRRLVDRYSGEVCLAIVEGREPPDGRKVMAARMRPGRPSATCVDGGWCDTTDYICHVKLVQSSQSPPQSCSNLRPTRLVSLDRRSLDLP
jgi:exoribonuclease R